MFDLKFNYRHTKIKLASSVAFKMVNYLYFAWLREGLEWFLNILYFKQPRPNSSLKKLNRTEMINELINPLEFNR